MLIHKGHHFGIGQLLVGRRDFQICIIVRIAPRVVFLIKDFEIAEKQFRVLGPKLRRLEVTQRIRQHHFLLADYSKLNIRVRKIWILSLIIKQIRIRLTKRVVGQTIENIIIFQLLLRRHGKGQTRHYK